MAVIGEQLNVDPDPSLRQYQQRACTTVVQPCHKSEHIQEPNTYGGAASITNRVKLHTVVGEKKKGCV